MIAENLENAWVSENLAKVNTILVIPQLNGDLIIYRNPKF